MTQIILLEDEKKMTLYTISQNSNSLVHALESEDWDPPDGMAK